MHEAIRRGTRVARRALLAGVRGLGGFDRFAASTWRRQRLLILCYHGVSLRDEHEWDPELFVTPEFLRRRFQILRDGGYRVLPLGDAVRSMRRGTLPPRSVVLTFDDGFYNFLAAAVPVLEEFGYTATNYVSTYYCVHQRPILGLSVRYLLWRSRRSELPAGLLPGRDSVIDLRDSRHRDALAASLVNEAQALTDPTRLQAWICELAARLGVDVSGMIEGRLFHLMTGEELAQAARRGFDIQLHTHRHRVPREKEAFCSEVRQNRRLLENFTGCPAIHFCYPSGDIDPVFLPWLRELAVETATTGVVGLAQMNQDPLLLPRYVDTMKHSELMFEGWLCGASAVLGRQAPPHARPSGVVT